MTALRATGPPAGPSPRQRRNRKAAATAGRRRRKEAAASAHRAVAASFQFDDVVAIGELPSERLFVRTDTLEPGEVHALLGACSSASRLGQRDRALVAAGYFGCIRASEAPRITLEDSTRGRDRSRSAASTVRA